MSHVTETNRTDSLTGNPERNTFVLYAKFGYALLAACYLACIIAQVLLAGMAVFVSSEYTGLHRVFANYFELVPILMLVLSFAGRVRGGMRWGTLALFALTALQHMTIRTFTGFLPALHTVDALLLFGIAAYMVKRSLPWLALKHDHQY